MNKYTEEAVKDILEICDGMSIDEIFEVIDAVEGVAHSAEKSGEGYFNFAEYLLTHRQGDSNA